MRTITTALLVLLLATGCASATGGSTKGSSTRSASSPKPTEQAEPEPEPVRIGTQRYVNPCRLLDTTDVQRIYGGAGKYASFAQEVPEGSVSTAEMREIDTTLIGSVQTSCLYSFDDAADTTVKVDVKQYSSPARAQKDWRRTKHLGSGIDSRRLKGDPGWEWLYELSKENEAALGGVRIPGLDPTVLFVGGHTWFVGVRDNLVITLSRLSYARGSNPFEPKQVKGTLSKTRAAFRSIYAHVDDEDLEQTPLPAYWEQQDGWPQFLDPCAVMDEAAMRAATGHGTVGEVRIDSVLRDPDTRLERNTKPGYKAVHNSCERTSKQGSGTLRNRYWHGDLELWYAAPGDSGVDLLDGFVVKRLFEGKNEDRYSVADLVKAKVMKPVTVQGADSAYVFDYDLKGQHYSWIVASTGRYMTFLSATRSKRSFSQLPMAERYLVAGTQQLMANIADLTKDG